MICEDLDREISAFKFRSPSLEASDNAEKLFVINFIIAFCRDKFLREEGYRM
jgi:hypothetical protein